MKPDRGVDAAMLAAMMRAVALVVALSTSVCVADEPAAPVSIARDFAARLEAAMTGGPVSWDRLWSRAARDSSTRSLDVRASALFNWTDVHVAVDTTSVRVVAKEGAPAEEPAFVDLAILVKGVATWDPRAFGVAASLWRPLHDELHESNHVVRREAWRLSNEGGAWRAVERTPLSPVHVRDLAVRASVFSRQEVLLVESTFSLVSEVDGLEAIRFLLDRRVEIYNLLVNDRSVNVIRGSELASLGLEGFSPENESSFRLPRALARGDEVLVKFRTRSPLVHLRGPGFVTTLPLHEGPFRERAWIPLFGAELERDSRESSVQLEVAWVKGSFERALLVGKLNGESANPWPEEESAVSHPTRPRSIDFVLLERGADAEDAFDVLRGVRGSDLRVVTRDGIHWQGGEDATEPFATPASTRLDPHPRSRRALVEPLTALSTYSSRDLASELQEVLPLDTEMLDELYDDAETNSERGADDRASD